VPSESTEGKVATRKLVVIASGPSHGAVGALELATAMKGRGQEVDVCLVEDAVLCARHGDDTPVGVAVAGMLRAGVALHYLEDDFLARGFGREDVRAEAEPLGYGALVELMLEAERAVLGAF
jgi:sulfur relay protein TusB/DsrH